MKYLSKGAAIDTVKHFFSQTDEDAISLGQAYQAWGRQDIAEAKNRPWLDNKLTHLKYHNLVSSVYSRNNSRRVLAKIQLTLEGKKAIGRVESNQTEVKEGVENMQDQNVSITEIMKMIAKLKEENPAFEINFNVKLKEQQ